MNANPFNPSSPKISRGHPISGWTYAPSGDIPIPRVESPDNPCTPERLQLYPVDRSLDYETECDGVLVSSNSGMLPSPSCFDLPTESLRSSSHSAQQPIQVEFSPDDPSSYTFWGKYNHKSISYYWRRGRQTIPTATGFYDTSFYRYSGLVYHLPEFFILDATDVDLTYSFSIGELLFTSGVGTNNNSKFLMRRDDHLDSIYYDQDWDLAFDEDFTFSASYPTRSLSLHGPVGRLPTFATYKPVYDILKRLAISSFGLTTGPTPTWILSCRPWGRVNGQGAGAGIRYFTPNWHLLINNPNEGGSASVWPKLYFPESAFYWRNQPGTPLSEVQTKDYRKWYTGTKAFLTEGSVNSEAGPIDTSLNNIMQHNPVGFDEFFESDKPLDAGPLSQANNGHLNPYGVTKFMLGSIGTLTEDNAPYANAASLDAAGRVLVTPYYP